MNIFITGIIIFIIVYLILSWFAKTSSQRVAKGARNLILIISLILAVIMLIGGRLLVSLPLFFLAMSALKIKGLTAFQIWNLWRVLNYLRSTGRFSYFGQTNQTRPSSNLSVRPVRLRTTFIFCQWVLKTCSRLMRSTPSFPWAYFITVKIQWRFCSSLKTS